VHDSPDRRLAELAAAQHGLLTLAQARGAGLSQRQIRYRVVAGTLLHVAPTVLSVAGLPLTWDRRLAAALLAAGPTAAVSHRSAAHVLEFDGFEPGPVEITSPRGRRVLLPQGAVLHSALRLDPIDVVTVAGLRVTSGARTILDLARRAPASELTAAIGSAIRDGWTTEPFLRRRLRARRGSGHHGVRLLDRVLEGPVGDSHLERRFLRLVMDAALPRPTTQRVVSASGTIRVDAIWEAYAVVAEVIGHRWHCTALDLTRDAQRRNELQSMGLRVLEFTADAIVRRPHAVVATLQANLAPRRLSEENRHLLS
jgi:very-short-patch-repair endonuclease